MGEKSILKGALLISTIAAVAVALVLAAYAAWLFPMRAEAPPSMVNLTSGGAGGQAHFVNIQVVHNYNPLDRRLWMIGNLVDVHGAALGGRTVSWTLTAMVSSTQNGTVYSGTATTAADGSFGTAAVPDTNYYWGFSFAGDASNGSAYASGGFAVVP